MGQLPKNNFTAKSDELKPRELMERAVSPSQVSDEALLAILLKTGVQGLDVIQLSRRLLEAFGSLKLLVSADWRSIKTRIKEYNLVHPNEQIKGIGHVKCLELAAAFEMGRRWARLSPNEIRKLKIETAEDAYRVFRNIINPELPTECVFVLLLDVKCHPICEPICVVKGEVASASFSPSEIFREAVRWGASALVVAHNHPSGNCAISEEDIELTRKLLATSELLAIPILDHLIIGDSLETFISIRDSYPNLFDER